MWGFIELTIEYASAKETKSNDADTKSETKNECKDDNDNSACLDSKTNDSIQSKSSNYTTIASDDDDNNKKHKDPFLLPFP
jgi:hypothetical protein